MNNETIFTVKKKHLDLLDEDTAVEFFSKLLWAEANRLGPGTCKINVPSETKIPDGGIDATVDADLLVKQSDIIAPGKNGYQIRSGTGFKPWRDGDVRKELFKKGSPKIPEKKHLKESIKDCLDECGTYILVCTGIDRLVPPNRKKASKLIKDYLKNCGYPDSQVDVWPQNVLIRFLKSFPSLCLWVNGRSSAKFQTHESWSRNANMQGKFVSGKSQDELIENLQSDLRCDDNAPPLLVSGQPGIGKTRLVLEATKAKDLAPQVIYSPADQFLQDKLLMDELCNDENDFSAIVVIDDCNLHSRSEILDKLKNRGKTIKLITIYNNHEEAAGDISPYIPQRLSDDQIRSVIQQHTKVPDLGDRRWVELCSGSPGIAHVVGWNLPNYPKDVLASLSTVNTWERYIVSVDDPSQERTEQRRRVLRYMALFNQFGFENPVGEEAKAVAKKIEQADPQITWPIFQEIVDNLKKRKILQGEFTFAITPKALHIKLWTEWWDIYGRTFDLDEFIQDIPCDSKLVEWFYEMFSYASESGVALSAVKDLLGRNGPFQQRNYLQTSLGSRFFLALAEANPKSAVECLKNTIGTWDKDTLLRFKTGRRNVVEALKRIAVWHDLFADAARLLLALGAAENERFSNNASGEFAELFSPGRGKLAPTEASPAERFPVLKEAFASGLKEHHVLALKACDIALKSMRSVRLGSPENQGLRQQPNLWMPKTYGELWNAYRAAWKLLEDQLPRLPEEERKKGGGILLLHARELTLIRDLSNMIVDTVATIAKKKYVDKKHVIKTINQILHYEGKNLDRETRKDWQNLLDDLVSPHFQSMMLRYVGMDLLEDKFDENRNYVDKAQPRIETLAQQAVDSSVLLQSELSWLVTTEAKKGFHFGYELGKRDDGFSFFSAVLEAQRNAGENSNTAFLGGYFRACFELDRALWETQIDALIDDTVLKLVIPALTSRSGLTDKTGLRLLCLARNDVMGVNDFKTFIDSTAVSGLSGEVFGEWIAFLLNVGNKIALSVALGLYHRYYVIQTSAPAIQVELAFRLLSNQLLFTVSDDTEINDTLEYEWTEISKAFLQLYPKKNLELAELMLSHFGEDGSIVSRYSQTCSVLDEITEKCPDEIWKQVSRLLENHEYSSKKFSLEQWLREGSSWGGEDAKPALLRVPHELIWKWIDKDTENRAWYFAGSLVPKTLSTTEWGGSLVQGLLIHYGEREDVRNCLCANYMTETYWGPASLHYEEKIRKLLDIKNCEDNWNVIRWIDEFVEQLKKDVEQAKVAEERLF